MAEVIRRTTVGGKVWHIAGPYSDTDSGRNEWFNRAERRAASGYVVTPEISLHPVDRPCPYCRVQVVSYRKEIKANEV